MWYIPRIIGNMRRCDSEGRSLFGTGWNEGSGHPSVPNMNKTLFGPGRIELNNAELGIRCNAQSAQCEKCAYNQCYNYD